LFSDGEKYSLIRRLGNGYVKTLLIIPLLVDLFVSEETIPDFAFPFIMNMLHITPQLERFDMEYLFIL